jgi:predicted O-methyltransferase YrrM
MKNRFKRNIWMSLLSSPNSYLSQKVSYLAREVEHLKWKERLQEAGIPEADKIRTYTNSRELEALYDLASNCPQNALALEVGSHLGASSCYIAAGLKKIDGHLFCVDTWNNETMPEGEQNTFRKFQENTSGVKQQITPVNKRSEEINAEDIKVPLDFIFIDGDHSYEAVKRDFEHTQKWLTEDGIIAFHDFSQPYFEGVTRVVGEALASGKWMILGQVSTLVWIQKAKWVQPTWVSYQDSSATVP